VAGSGGGPAANWPAGRLTKPGQAAGQQRHEFVLLDRRTERAAIDRSWTRSPAPPATPSPATPSGVNALGVAPDKSWLATARDDATVRVWDPATGTALTSLRVARGLACLATVATTIAAAGEHGPYFLTFVREPRRP
jgi:WD40 repeat protein